MRAFTVGLALATATITSSATAATYRFDVIDGASEIGDQPFSPYFFFLDSSPSPLSVDDVSFTLNGTTFGQTFSDVAVMDTYTFYNDQGGGFDDYEGNYLGATLFTGSLAHPTFKLGTFALDNLSGGASLTISEVAVAAVPEMGSWSLMIVGLGIAGAALRRRRAKVSVSYA